MHGKDDEYDEERKEFSKEPRNDWASHDGDAYSYGALLLEEDQPKIEEDTRARILHVGDLPEGTTQATLDDLWREHERGASRRARV